MATNTSRSQNDDLRKGALDGAFKNLTPDRGGDVETAFVEKRQYALQEQYSMTDKFQMAEAYEPVINKGLGTK